MARTSLICRMLVIVYFLSFAKIGPCFQSPIQIYSWLDLSHDKLSDYKALPMPLLVIIWLACTKAII